MDNKWNLSLLFNSESEIEEYREKIKEKVELFLQKWKDNMSYMEDPKMLKVALDEYSALDIVGPTGGDGAGTKDSFYFWLKSQQDQNNTEIKAKFSKAMDFANKLFNSIRFFKINLGNIKKELQNGFINSQDLHEYRHFIERTFVESKYVLGVNEENILTLKEEVAHSNWQKMLSGFIAKSEREVIDEDGQKKIKNFSEIGTLLSSKRKESRDSAGDAFNSILVEFMDVAESEINSILRNKKIDDDLRGTTRPDELRHIADDISTKVVDCMLDSVTARFDISRRYYLLKAKLLGFDKLKYHERNVPYGELSQKYNYEEAIKLVGETFADLDKDFLEVFNRLKDNGQVDVFPSKGKKIGAFCTDSLLYQPTYILLNHTDLLRDVLTIAHEFGHAINSEFMKKKCNTLSCGMVTSTAEVASTFMEDFVIKKLLEKADDETKLSLMMFKLNEEITSIMRQVACYKFEQALHKEFREKGYLKKEEIGTLFKRNMEDYMGLGVEQSEGSENWWIHWHHIRYFFYVYSYASGLLISKSLQRKVKDNPEFISNVKEFFAAGTRESPEDIFKKLGVDINDSSFWNAGLDEINHLLMETENLAKKLGKINN